MFGFEHTPAVGTTSFVVVPVAFHDQVGYSLMDGGLCYPEGRVATHSFRVSREEFSS